jgi:hypothetical protein
MSTLLRGGFRAGVMRVLLASSSFLLVSSLILLNPETLRADTINASADADLSDTTGNGTFDTIDRLSLATHGLYITNFIGASTNPFEDRAVILFSLASIPANAQITGLSFNFDETGFANAVGTVAIDGYSSNGTISLADATAASSQLGTYDALSLGLGDHSVTLSTSYLQSLLAGGASYLGIRLEGTQYSVNTQLGSIEQATFFTPPTLTVTLQSVPEPASIILLISGATLGAGLHLRRKPRRAA